MESRFKLLLTIWVTIIVLCFIIIPIHFQNTADPEIELTAQFQNYTLEFGKDYSSSLERHRRYSAFKRSITTIHHLNSKPSISNKLEGSFNGNHDSIPKWKAGMPKNTGTAVWGLTAMADLTSQEFQAQYLDVNLHHHIQSHRKKSSKHHSLEHGDPGAGIRFENLITKRRRRRSLSLAKIDWRTKGIVTPIKQQKNCGACWAFSTVETVESMHALTKGTLQTLSVQQVIDCSKNGNLGCNGGDTCTAIEWMTGRQLATEKDYPTTLKTESCLLMSASNGVKVNSNFSCKSFSGREQGLMDILATHGPATVAVDATNWQYYVGGIIQWNCDNNLNHAVQVVGYDSTGDIPHYIVRNSWGTQFGDAGYLYIASGSNLCGIADHVAWLSVS